MFIGHFGTAFGAKAAAPGVSLGTLFVAAQFIDLLWPVLLLVGLEQVSIVPGITRVTPLDFTSYPISHSLLMVCLWGAVIGGGYWLVRKNRTAAVTLGLLVISHWALDFFVHRPDLPLAPGGETRVGLGLWDSAVGTVLLEGGIFALGVFFYLRTSRARDRIGTWAFWGVTEKVNGVTWLVYVQDRYTIVRRRVPDGLLTTVASFTSDYGLGGMDSITVSPRFGRWYFHHYSWSIFRRLVGPRPHVQLEVDYYTSEQCRRLSVPPGLTGLWQVEGKADCTFHELIKLDLEYIERWSLLLDFSIITRTVLLMMRGGEGFWSRMAKKLPTQRKNGRGYLSEAVHEPQVILESEKTES